MEDRKYIKQRERLEKLNYITKWPPANRNVFRYLGLVLKLL